MSDYIRRIFRLFSRIFVKENERPKLKRVEIPPSRYATPLGSRARVPLSAFGDFDTSGHRFHSYPGTKLQRMQKQLPIGRCPSEATLSRSSFATGTPLKPSTLRMNRWSEPTRGRTFKPLRHVYGSATADMEIPKYMPATEFCSTTAQKSPKSSKEFYVTADDWSLVERAISSPTNCDKPASTRKPFHWRTNHSPRVADHPFKWNASSKIPVHARGLRRIANVDSKMSQQPRGRLTMPSRSRYNELNDSQRDEEIGDCNRFPDVSNWIMYRNDTSSKFERVFKFLSKKKKHTIGNVIDSNSHLRWMQLAGICADRDATMFKQFAGGKVVLTIGEYKFLIDKICSFYDLDYWDVLRKMATFLDEDMHEAHLTPS